MLCLILAARDLSYQTHISVAANQYVMNTGALLPNTEPRDRSNRPGF
jgi:hypothetical protein